jgi:pimeloyl-ACP methyl ester carboxylesterase
MTARDGAGVANARVPAPERSRRLAIDGTVLAYVERGDPYAEPVVLLHGYVGSHLSWRHQIEPSSKRPATT